MSDKFKITSEEINQTLLHSPFALSDTPYQKGMGAGQIKKYFYDFIVTLASKLNIHLGQIGDSLDSATSQEDEKLAELKTLFEEGLVQGIDSHNLSEEAHSDIRALIEQAVSQLEASLTENIQTHNPTLRMT